MDMRFTPIQTAIQEWIEDSGATQDEINESQLIRWATDAVNMVETPELLCHRTILLNVKNYKADLPEDFKLLCQAASNPKYADDNCLQCGDKPGVKKAYAPTRREQIVQWKQKTMCDTDCELEINLICPRCDSVKCSCDSNVVEVDVDRIWEQAHPELYYKNFFRIGRFGQGNHRGKVDNDFRLMSTATSHFHNVQKVLGDCPSLYCPECYHTFIIKNRHIEVDFKEGEILLSYLGKQTDENGNIMIPDHPDMLMAIFFHLEYKFWWRDYRKTSLQTSLNKHTTSLQQREQYFGIFRDAVEMPEFHTLKKYLEDAWIRRIPKWTSDSLGHETTDPYHLHGQRLKDPNNRI